MTTDLFGCICNQPQRMTDALIPVREALVARGHDVERSSRHWSAAEIIVIDAATGRHLGGADPRTDGAAVGVDLVKDVAGQVP